MKTFAIVCVLFVASTQALPSKLRSYPGRIVGGTEAVPNEFPYMCSLRLNGQHICGATIVRGNAVVTGAVCAEAANGLPGLLEVWAGKHNITTAEATEQMVNVLSIHIHPRFDGEFQNDIAVLKTEEFQFNRFVRPLPIAQAGHVTEGNVTVIGWGSTREGGPQQGVLRKVDVTVMPDSYCRIAHSSFIEEQMLCAGVPQGGKDSCTGDSGGPLIGHDMGYDYLAGLVSWGFGCARPGFPGVYAEVSHYNDFLEQELMHP